MTSLDLDPRSFAHQDYFSVLGLPLRQGLDLDELEARYRDVQARVHPDKHAHLSDADRRISMQWATKVNEAYQTLKNPLARAQYLLEQRGFDPRLESNTAMAPGFLVEQMTWRETVAEAREAGAADELDGFHRRLRREMAAQYEELRVTIDETKNYPRAAEIVREMKFKEKLLHEIDEALAEVDA